MAIYNKETSPNSILFLAKVGLKFCQILKRPPNLPQANKGEPKWRNFAKSGHIECDNCWMWVHIIPLPMTVIITTLFTTSLFTKTLFTENDTIRIFWALVSLYHSKDHWFKKLDNGLGEHWSLWSCFTWGEKETSENCTYLRNEWNQQAACFCCSGHWILAYFIRSRHPCTADLLFYLFGFSWFGFDQRSKSVIHSI